MANKPTMSFRASSEEQKTRWEKAVEENEEYDSMSHLIRKSVERELTDGGTPTAPATSTNANIGELVSNIEKVHHTLNKQAVQLQEATDAMYESTKDIDYTADVFEALPTTADEAKDAHEIAEEVDAPTREISVTLARLKHKTGVVKVIGQNDLQESHPDAAETVNTSLYYKEV